MEEALMEQNNGTLDALENSLQTAVPTFAISFLLALHYHDEPKNKTLST